MSNQLHPVGVFPQEAVAGCPIGQVLGPDLGWQLLRLLDVLSVADQGKALGGLLGVGNGIGATPVPDQQQG